MNGKANITDRRDRNAETDKPFQDEVEHPDAAGGNPTAPDDKGDRQRQDQARKGTRRTE